MPLDVNCPKCAHVFPVTEAKHPFAVQCPGCDAELTAEFRKLPVPVPGQPHYDLLVTPGRPQGVPPAVPGQSSKKLALDEEDEEGGKKRKGGGMAIVFVVGIGALLVALGGLGATGYFLFTNLDTDEPSYTSSGPRSNTNTNPKGNPNPKGVNPKGVNPKGGGDPFGGGGDPFNPPKKVDKFDYRPVGGNVPAITPPPNLPPDNTTLEIDLQGRVGAITVAGGGRYIVVHIPDRGLLGLFDATKGQMVGAGDTDRGDVKLAGGLDRVVTVAEIDGKKKLRSFSLPDLKQQFETTIDMTFGPHGVMMGNRTNSPAVVWDPFGELYLFELTPTGAKEVDGARKRLNPGIHAGVGKAFPDGTAFVTYDTHNLGSIRILSHDAAARDWRTDNTRNTPSPSADGFLYGKGVVNDKSGKDARFAGVGANAGWFVPATTASGYFLKLAPTSTKAKGARPTMAVTFHTSRNASVPIAGAPVITGTPDLDGFGDGFSGNYNEGIPADQHFFLIPEAKLLVILNTARTKFTLRKVDLMK